MKPVIGVTCSVNHKSHYLADDYVLAIRYAGGVPVLLPVGGEEDIPLLLSKVDGILLSGGGDIDPFWFGEEPVPGLGEIEPGRDAFEIKLCRQVLIKDMPLLAICRGMQVLTVAAGGDMFQDIYSQMDAKLLQHRQQAARTHLSHTVKLSPGSLLEKLAGCHFIKVNSFHHQAVRTVPKPFEVCGRASDGIIEAVENCAARFAIGVQWHPEALIGKNDLVSKNIFSAFIRACRGN
ncbi:gamma-glutamyl-gamma-aminobutyrate hydrolase family protein [Weizmannia acidilactici]|uniref:gamma-glutamyl-gamma-aminobutyrate hydrolase family protein n=1 Tax=Weizmannia acidilactici TaxID=2607726 RepID=UPI00124DD101|nr:gamma-glutamyl-gamma-aminobutyrate hydrolase family protein [Weizmannia acidilactici]GER65839.1 peptidase C26 [Weizmannia acidilactici]GER73090.1 peptidase C26 [Weizmannia acidilactici]